MSDLAVLHDPGCGVPPAHPLEAIAAVERDQLGVRAQLNRRVVLDAANQVARHAVGQAARADEHVDPPRGLGQEHRRLSGRVASADDDHLVAAAGLRLDERRAVVDAGAFESREVLDRGAPVLHAGGDDHRPRRHPHAIVDDDREGRSLAGEFGGASGDQDLRAEFLRLRVGAAGQLLTRNPRGEAEIVFDPRAGAGLAARRVRLEHENVEPFGRAVDRGREPGRAGADDHQVAHVRLIDRVVEAEALGNLGVGRVPEHDLAAAHQHRHVRDGDPEVIEQRLNVGLAVEIDVGVGVAVPGEELLDPERARRVHRSDQHRVAEAAADQLHPPENERPHQDLAELGVVLHERQHRLAIEHDDLARLADPRAEQRAAPRDHVDLAAELPRAVHGDECLRAAGHPDHLDGALRDHEKRHHVIAGFDQDVAVLDGTHRPMRRDARDLRGGENGKHVVRARRGAKSRWTLSHVPSYSWPAVISRTS